MKSNIKKIAFFTVGFAFNRLVRMKFYEKIFPKNVEIYLITTDKYSGKEKENYQQEYSNLKRTKILKLKYGLSLPFELRKICKKNKIDRLLNLGYHTSWPLLFFATLGTKTDYCINVLTDMFNQFNLVESYKEKLIELITLPYMWAGGLFAKKLFFTDRLNSIRARIFFLKNNETTPWLAAPVDTRLFRVKNKDDARKKLKIPLTKKVVIFVGRVNYLKCSDILMKLIKEHKDILFLVIGRVLDKNFQRFRPKNLIHYDKKSSKELVDYYNASDISFCLNRGGGGIGLATEEAMACGVPCIISEEFKLKKNPALIEIPIDYNEANQKLKSLINLTKKDRAKLSKIARDYIIKNYSDDVWQAKYIKYYLE